jgi:hypothetical protein
VIVFVATAIAVLATISSGRVVTEQRHQRILEDETRAYNRAFAQLHMALNVVNGSAYNNQNQNLVIRNALAAAGSVTTEEEQDRRNETVGDDRASSGWLDDPTGVEHGYIEGTNVRVYRGRDYIKRIQKLRGDNVNTTLDQAGESDSFFVIESAGRSGNAVRLVSALVRENEPFSSFVFFQNRHPLGVSGSPRGLIHSNNELHFYFPNGNYVDPVSAVGGFDHKAGAADSNTTVLDGNPNAQAIVLEAVDFNQLKAEASLFTVADGLDAEIAMYADGRVRVRSMTPPHWDLVSYDRSRWVIDHYDTITETRTRTIQVGTMTEEYDEDVIDHYDTETYTEMQDVLTGYVTETRTRTVQVQTGTESVERTRSVPVWMTRTVTRTRWVEVFVPYDDPDGGGGTAVGGGGGVAGEYEWVEEEYETTEDYIDHWDTEIYYEDVPVYADVEEEYTVEVPQYEQQEVTLTRDVPVYVTVTRTREVPVYDEEEYEHSYDDPVWIEESYTEDVWEFQDPQMVQEDVIQLSESVSGTIYVDGRITKLGGELNGRLTIVGNEKVRVTDSIRYVDDDGDTSMLNGDTYTEAYERNEAYEGPSVLGVIARDDVLFTNRMPDEAEVNATLMSVEGRVGIDGFAINSSGDPTYDYYYGMTPEERQVEDNYNRTSYRTRRFRKDSLRRIGGLISNDRILETFIRPDSNGNAYVDSGFKRGSMKFDINLIFNPPPNFVQVPRPVLQFFTPVFVTGSQDL